MHDLIDGRIDFGCYASQTYGFDRALFLRQWQERRDSHVLRMNWFRREGQANLPKSDWVLQLCRTHGILSSPEDRQKLSDALDAAYRFDHYCAQRAARTRDKTQPSDGLDWELEFYLSNPNLRILTENMKDLQGRIGSCPQAKQISVVTIP